MPHARLATVETGLALMTSVMQAFITVSGKMATGIGREPISALTTPSTNQVSGQTINLFEPQRR